MHHTGKPILIFAQSGRFLAQSATQAGYRVWVADCFGDLDTLEASERWQPLPPLSELAPDQVIPILNKLTNGEACSLLFGSGIEKYYSIIIQLPSNISYIGNTESTINLIQTPELFFNLLATQALPFPTTVFSKPSVMTKSYLAKSRSGFGGSHINVVSDETLDKEYYYQQYINGQAGSVLFIANGNHAELISINKQNISSNEANSFCLSSIETPFGNISTHKTTLINAINQLTLHAGLVGLNSLDFIISTDNSLFILEINPRLSASAELYNNKSLLFEHHLLACIKKELKALPKTTTLFSSLHYLFASSDSVVPDTMAWPLQCHDIPDAGTQIKKQSPICTLMLTAKSKDEAYKQYENIKTSINIQLNTLN